VKANKNVCNAHALCLFLSMSFACLSNIYEGGWNSVIFYVSRQAETGIILNMLFVYALRIPHIKVVMNAIWKIEIFAVVYYHNKKKRQVIMNSCFK
jgi:high-affinity Fe2+/Pb2+ permease